MVSGAYSLYRGWKLKEKKLLNKTQIILNIVEGSVFSLFALLYKQPILAPAGGLKIIISLLQLYVLNSKQKEKKE